MAQKTIQTLFTFFLLSQFFGCDFVYRLLDKQGAEEKELVGEIVPFEKNPTIEEIQMMLRLYGYNPGNIDGVLGLRTRNSIEKFQSENNLEVTRFVDKETWKKLSTIKEKGLIKEGGLNVELIQKILSETGYNPGSADGKLGPNTLNAVKNFQKSHQLKADGKIGYKTLSAFSSYLN